MGLEIGILSDFVDYFYRKIVNYYTNSVVLRPYILLSNLRFGRIAYPSTQSTLIIFGRDYKPACICTTRTQDTAQNSVCLRGQ